MTPSNRWSITSDCKALHWDCELYPADHTDFIEMSGLYTSAIITYGLSEGKLTLHRHSVFPMLRIFPNITRGSLQCDIPAELVPVVLVGGEALTEYPAAIRLMNGAVSATSYDGKLLVDHRIFPSADKAALCELVEIQNCGDTPVRLSVTDTRTQIVCRTRGPMGVNLVERTVLWRCPADGLLPPDGKASLHIFYTGRVANEPRPAITDAYAEYAKRTARVEAITAPLTLSTGNHILDTLFHFAKLRAGESIFRTRNGDIHCPGGGNYYAAVWCNDQAEYAGPWQAWTGDEIQLNAAYNGYAWYYPHMDDRYEPLPSSIIAEGMDFWNGAGDRGDAAMYLFGASRYALVSGRLGEGNALWTAIKWCAEYCLRRMENDLHPGLIPSDSDELEGRLPTGKINLSTNMLALGGFQTAAALAEEMGEPATAESYRKAAATLEAETEAYFAGEVHGFDTYKYYDGNTTLRSWICLPLCMDIATHAKGTADAITSPYLYGEAGQLSEEGTNVAWDRSTLYGLRGMLRAAVILQEQSPEEGRALRKIAADYLMGYGQSRLLGDHVPYAIEAYPEGGKRHLSAESALLCQVVTEGILAVKPLSFTSFSFNTVIPESLPRFRLTNIRAFGETFELTIQDGLWNLTTKSGKQYGGHCQGRVTVNFAQ
ncbi:MAG: hypothetical protein E7610_08975 [Ruminococcaceae bacterium]|nr:hypothetical protein [Oscillospiraceae bacterium]